MTNDFRNIASILADWSHPHSGIVIYLFGSRVRGDHRSGSDVDVLFDFASPSDSSTAWLTEMEAEDYASLKIQLPGPLELLERRSQLDTRKILADFAAV
ncbi:MULTISPECIES: nucleotidyltransferase domain-containing protein [unclassified Minwuia]|jgi:predicted nucleotidyltransferase|uniref:nucleotidyltransferase family protein n=1 Tax=unclassified Minwuia TaxID=2618799 RepID=UPI002479897A|nr:MULTISPECIES: nucleotidyltransferase domain-containing protein [unclassified Minwuia]